MDWPMASVVFFPVIRHDRMLSSTVRWKVIQFSQNFYVILIELLFKICGMFCVGDYMLNAIIYD